MAQRLLPNAQVPVVGFVAPQDNGLTDLLGQVITLLQAQQLRVAVVKEALEDFDMDQPGKDSYRYNDPHIIAIGSDQPERLQTSIPILDLNKPSTIAEFLISLIHAHRLP
jgi:molybdopterin-guanine dinucleotide biosynthesis protein